MEMYTTLLLPSCLARSCRIIAGRRYPPAFLRSTRQFHQSFVRWSPNRPHDPHDASNAAPADNDGVTNDAAPEDRIDPAEDKGTPEAESSEASSTTSEAASNKPRSVGRTGPYGSGIRRALRNRKPPPAFAPPAATIPTWFRERNIFRYSDNSIVEQREAPVAVVQQPAATEDTSEKQVVDGGKGSDDSGLPGSADTQPRYPLSEEVWEELYASAKAGLILPPAQYANEPSTLKSHLLLQYPGDDGILFLDSVVRRLAQELKAKLITLNAQDIAFLCSEQDRADTGMTSPIRSLGYEVYRSPSSIAAQENEDVANDADAEEGDFDSPSRARGDIGNARFIAVESPRDFQLPNWLGLKSLVASISGPVGDSSGSNGRGGNRAEHRWLRLITELLSPTPARSTTEAKESTGKTTEERRVSEQPVIVQIQDYKDIQASREGSRFLALMQQAIQARRRDGHKVLMVGTVARDTTTDRELSRFSTGTVEDPLCRTLTITPALNSKEVEEMFSADRKRRTMEVNIRHLQDMLRTRVNEKTITVDASLLSDVSWPLGADAIKEFGLSDGYWGYNHVHRVATLAIGCVEPNGTLTLDHIRRGMKLIEATDRIRNDWLREKQPPINSPLSAETSRKERLAALRKTCNAHERKLLNGVVDAASIRTTFDDVHVPPETVEALKTLTSLSLIRPEAFTYGVLATDRIPGLLLYGPPGTGKTLLAKAVARDSGATVLEVSGSEVYDMYVGEGEKNVKAIFTLAKKLSPCVVFIDEADAIFCSRTGASSRTSHRELINQFLREWDGMNEMSAFIMVATNRPFDLDDAVLRRLPRRLLVDLPTEKDRRAILKIHLKDEKLDSTIDLDELARRTPLYSGSDLKNLCVAAALACVREENELAAKHTGPEPYRFPERRVLSKRHFEKGMEEISASISEDMSSLTAIRRFDEKYGDRKGRRPKGPGWGFTPPGAQPETDSARVRT